MPKSTHFWTMIFFGMAFIVAQFAESAIAKTGDSAALRMSNLLDYDHPFTAVAVSALIAGVYWLYWLRHRV
ncbi:hypothetical protein [Methylomonas sp. UP202]|uniref:Uncharacterized protein n=1 Tax=Methylomonas koyamae TaxID=702114 RepID=A0A177NIK5_9GAMM|nr:hypothetical protein [Methylomonas sp. UP202]NJA05788.1 hypothetical protein [Methylococcaceae bacterium WWC4]OAI17878.1 hypothetical protein A1355_06770 [Methylomonas koyamae]WGS86457.1 hypothetical protein QC632_01540 [Methylomonas sp. UP202]